MTGAGLTVKERLFVAMAWTPKATVQAGLGAAPLDAIIRAYGADSSQVEYGKAILATAVFAVLVCAPIALGLIQWFAPRLLKRTDLRPRERRLVLAGGHNGRHHRRGDSGNQGNSVSGEGRHLANLEITLKVITSYPYAISNVTNAKQYY